MRLIIAHLLCDEYTNNDVGFLVTVVIVSGLPVEPVPAVHPRDVNRELKKLRRQLQGKRLIKIELCVKLSLLRLFQVDHVVQNRRSALSLAWYEWFSCKGKEEKIYCSKLPLSTEPQM